MRQAAVVAVPDERLIEVPFAFVVLTKGGPVEAAEILSWMNGRLARFKVPGTCTSSTGSRRSG